MKELEKLTDRELSELNFATSMLILNDLNYLKSQVLKDETKINFASYNNDFKLIYQALKSIKSIKISDDWSRTL